MSGHTNRNKRNGGNGGNPRSRRGPPRQRGADGRPGSQPKNDVPPAAESDMRESEQPPAKDPNRSARASQPPTQSTPPTGYTGPEQASSEGDDASLDEPVRPHDQQQPTRPSGRAPFAALSHGGHAYIPANGSRLGMNGQGGANGQNRQNGHMPPDRRSEAPVAASSMNNDDDGNDSEATPETWRTERLNGGVDSTPREPFRPESRGEVGSLVDSLHELFAQDRAVASQGDGTRCGICYLHFPLNALEYREVEGFYICAGCRRALGHQQVMMIRRQQAPRGA